MRRRGFIQLLVFIGVLAASALGVYWFTHNRETTTSLSIALVLAGLGLFIMLLLVGLGLLARTATSR